ncbi:PEPxxWA-CTERM sorting domain-containing protein [Phenylobacterium sp.]|uniref:PEPxxWA-CTERM sorting domain-containing protein n=1 Tax=Phenylobacterium sp. TaxID=1871053 RepID=UPI0025EEBD76|nr:PEPxxWA-CTERM sorting domain-containing protein [Phenylobacterium sp.]
MYRKFIAAMTAGAVALGAGAASAATYVSKLEYSQAGYTSTPFGTVTIEELDANNVKITVALPGIDKIVDTGNGHVAFAFNLSDNPNSTVTVLSPTPSSFTYAGEKSAGYKMSPFGQTWTNAIVCCGQGASNGEPPPLVFKVSNASGISFLGSGNKFTSNTDGTIAGYTGGWWFAVDTFDADRPAGGNTFAVAARDVTCTSCSAVPEPATWTMMILGFGGAGAVIRRRRFAAA